LREYLSDLGTWHLILLGIFSIAIIVTDRRGLWGLIRRFALPTDLIPTAHRSSSQKTAMAERARV
jgi:branched-chain amino acid transport system permease protein